MASKPTFSYIKNVGKSFGYAFVDVMKTNNPVLTSLAKEAKETTSSIYQTVKDFKMSASDNEKSLIDDAKDATKSLWKNLRDDLKTGNWYNKERSKEAEEAMAKAMGFDLGDFDFNMDFDDDWGDDVSDGEAAQIGQDVKNTAATIMAMDDTGNRVANAVNSGTVASAEYIVKSSKQMNLALYDLNKRGFNQVTEALMGVNSTTAKFADAIGKPLTTHINNSQIFFTNVTQSLNNIEKHLVQIEKNTTSAPLAANFKAGTHGGIGSIISEDGINVSAYKDMIKKNLSMYKDIFGMATGAVKNVGGLNAAAKTVSPMQYVTTSLITYMLPKMLKDSMGQLNDNLSALLSGALTKGSGKSSSGLLGFLQDIFFPKKDIKRNLNQSNYNKGAVAWDGIARKALIEVIPTTLFKIYSAITGEDEMRYNYETGKFVTVKSLRGERSRFEQIAANSAAGKFRDEARSGESESIQEELDAYFLHAFLTGDPATMKGIDKNGKAFNLSSKAKAKIMQTIGTKKHNSYHREVAMASENYSNSRYREEASGHSVESALYNGSTGRVGSAMFAKDYQAKVIYYLEGIYKNTWYGGGSGSDKGGRPNGKGPVMFNQRQAFGPSGAGEKSKAQANEDIKKEKTAQEQRVEEMQKEWEDINKGLSEKGQSFKDKISNAIDKHFPGLSKLMQAPINAFAKFVDKFTDGVTDFLWGDKGILEYVKDKFTDKFPGAKKAVEGFWGDTKESLRQVGSSLGATTKRIIGIHDKPEAPKVDQAYNGRQVTKTGIVAVSEGELIIPSEFNPFFRGRTDKKRQMREENEAIQEFYGAFRKGNKRVGKKQRKSKAAKAAASSDDAAAADEPVNEPFGFLDYLRIFGDNVKSKVSGAADKALGNEFTKQLNASLKKAGLKEARGNMGAGFLIGAVGGGMFGSPIMGALLGTTIGYITKSQTAQKFLFGDIDPETGDRKGGLLPKNVSNFITKNIPSIGKGAALGGIGGAFLGSPIMGAILGSTIGYVSSSKKAQEFLFGKDIVDEKGNVVGYKKGLISKELQDHIKKAAPNMAAGTIAGLLIGPFGPVGNMVVGSALGMVTSTNKFKEFFFGDGKEKEGLLKKIQKKIFGNITELFMNIGNRIRFIGSHWLNLGKNLITGLFGKISKFFEEGKEGKHGFLGKLAGGLLNFGVSAVGAPIRRMSTMMRRRNLRQGFDVFDKNEGRNLYASERMGMRKTYAAFAGNGIFNGGANRIDQAIANISTTEDLDRIQKMVAGAQRGDVTAIEELQKWSDQNKLGLVNADGKVRQNKLLNVQKLLKTESGDKRFKTPEQIAQETTAKASNKILMWLTGHDVDGKPVSAKEQAANEKVKEAAEQQEKKTVFGPDGKPRQTIVTKDGETELDMTDQGTRDSVKNQEELEKAQKDTPGAIRSMTSSIGGFFGKLGNTLFGTKDSPSLLGKAVNFVKENFLLVLGAIGIIKSFLTGGKLAEVITKAATAAIKGAKNILSGIWKGLTGGAYGSTDMEQVTAGIDPQGREMYQDEYGVYHYVDEEGSSSIQGTQQGPDSLSTRLKKTILQAPFRGKAGAKTVKGLGKIASWAGTKISNRLAKGKGVVGFLTRKGKAFSQGLKSGLSGSVAGKKTKLMGKIGAKVGSLAKSVKSSKAAKALTSVADDAVAAMGNSEFVSGLNKIFKKIPFLSKNLGKEGMEAAASEMTEGLAKAAGKQAFASAVKGILWVTAVATAVIDFSTGWQDARNTFKITDTPTTGQRLASGLLRMLKNLIPFGTLVPDSKLIDLFVKVFGKTGFLNADELKNQRESAQSEVDAYNAEHGTDYTIQEYNKAVQADYTWTENLARKWDSLWHKENREQNKATDARVKFNKLIEYNKSKAAGDGMYQILEKKYWDDYYAAYMTKNSKAKKAIEKAIKADKKEFKDSGSISDTTASSYNSQYSGGSSGIINQYDPRYKGMSIGGNSFASKGCGPAVAAMAAQAAGKSLSVNDAVSMSRPYQNSNGVSADYFTSVLGSRGIRTSYSTNPNQIARNIAGGGNTILLGSDPTNGSKANSPFGPNSHYVLATGTDANGNILIKDPEANGVRAYNPNILKSAKLGIYTGGAGVLPDTPIAQQVWSFFRQQGFSPAATAGIMGNLYQESGMKPDIVQKGSGHAAGIAQWESYKNKSGRWLNMANYAASRGKDWTDLDSQLNFILQELSATGMQKRISGETAKSNIDKMNAISGWNIPYGITYDQFKNTDDLRVSTGLFEAAFERAGKPNMEGRYNNALDYYNKYSGGQYDKVYAPSTGTVQASNTNGGESDEEPTTFGNLISKIMGAFSKGFGLGGNTSSGSTSTTASSDGTGVTSDPKGFDFTGAQQPIDYMKAIERKIDYSMKGPRDPDQGSADCSSTVRWAIQKAGGPNIGGNTSSQYNNKNLETVWYNNANYMQEIPSTMKPNDIIFFQRPNGDWAQSHPDKVGHVGMYLGNGEYIHHPGGKGPKIEKLPLGNKGQILKVSRVKASGAGSGLKPARFIGGASGTNAINNLKSQSTAMLSNMATNIRTASSNGSMSPELAQQLLMAILEVLQAIANNTASVGQIYQTLTTLNSNKKTISRAEANATSNKTEESAVGASSAFKNVVSQLSAIARG